MTKAVFLPLYNWTLWIMAKISLQSGHEILPNSPTEERISLSCSRCEYWLAQPIVAQYESFFQKLPTHDPRSPIMMTLPLMCSSCSAPIIGDARMQVIYILWPVQEGTCVPQQCISPFSLHPIKLWPPGWRIGVLRSPFSLFWVSFHLHHLQHRKTQSALWEWKG